MEPQLKAENLGDYLMAYMRRCVDFEVSKERQSPQGFRSPLDGMESYWAIRKKIQQYQKDSGISGVVWKEIRYRGLTVRVPYVHDQLISVLGDKEILIAATPDILAWWTEVTEGMNLWMSVPSDDDERDEKYIPVQLEEILVSAPLAEWAEVHLWESPETNIISAETGESWTEPTFDLNLELAWGIPENVPYAGHPESGSAWFSATRRNLDSSKLDEIFNKDTYE